MDVNVYEHIEGRVKVEVRKREIAQPVSPSINSYKLAQALGLLGWPGYHALPHFF